MSTEGETPSVSVATSTVSAQPSNNESHSSGEANNHHATEAVAPTSAAPTPTVVNDVDPLADVDVRSLNGHPAHWLNIIDALMANPSFEAFYAPVDWEAWGLLDYPTVVTRPMDLGTMKTKLGQSKYPTFLEFNSDFRLIVTNCKKYNLPASPIHKLAIKLDKAYEKEVLKAVKRAGGVVKATVKQPSQEDRDRFCRILYQLNANQVGKIIELLDEACPTAIDRTAKDELDLNVEAITPEAFTRVDQYLKEASVTVPERPTPAAVHASSALGDSAKKRRRISKEGADEDGEEEE